MTIRNNLKLIQDILDLANAEYRDEEKNIQMMRELGYLMGLLARLANDDNFVYGSLRSELKRLQEKFGTGARDRT